MNKLALSLVLLPLCCAHGIGAEVGVIGYATQFKASGPLLDVSHMGFGLRASLDSWLSIGHRDQFSLSITPKRNTDGLSYGFAGIGYSICAVSPKENWFASIGSEVRFEEISTKNIESGDSVKKQTLRPWVIGSVGFKGLFLPLPGFEIANHYLTQSKKIYHFTRLELAYPLLRANGDGLKGALAKSANCPQIGVQLGVRF